MIQSIPALSYHFGLSPSDVWSMTAREYAAYRHFMDEMRKERRHG